MIQNHDPDVDDELMQRIVAVLRRRKELSFEESVREYRQVEAEFVERAGNNEAKALATKQSITNHLLMEAERTEQPHKVCRKIWEELVLRGFLTMELRHVLSRTYARCCQHNGEFNAGIEVLESRIAELEQLLQDSTLTPENRFYCDETIRIHNEIRNELKTGIRE